ncbi:MAG: hypothetical protein WCI22_12755, partial [Actinomycetota bacterium]
PMNRATFPKEVTVDHRRRRTHHAIGLAAMTVAMVGCGSSSADVASLDSSGKYVAQVATEYPPRSGYSAVTAHIEGDGTLRYRRESQIRESTNRCLVVGGHASLGPLEYTQDQLTAEFVRPVLAQFSSPIGYSDEGSPTASAPTTSPGAADAAARLDCGRSAMSKAMVDAVRYESTRQTLAEAQASLMKTFWESTPLRRLDTSWSACMKVAGIAAATPNDAHARAIHTPDETRIASADRHCRDATDYTTTFDRLFTSAEAEFIVGHTSLIDEVVGAGQLPS